MKPRSAQVLLVGLLLTIGVTALGQVPPEPPTRPEQKPPKKPEPARDPSAPSPSTAQRLIDLSRAATPPLALLPTPKDLLMDPKMARSWAELSPRTFIATTADLGFVYARPRISFGYGRPFTSWVGADLNLIASGSGLGAYSGLRLEVPHFDLRIGTRFFGAFVHTYLESKAHYERIELETYAGDETRVFTHEAEAEGSIPFAPLALIWKASVSYVTGIPEGKSAFEETLHVIVEPPWVWRARGGIAFYFGELDQHHVALVSEVLDVPLREDSATIRVGPVLRFVLSRRAELRGSFVVTVVSPDSLGLIGGDFTELGVRYRWASE